MEMMKRAGEMFLDAAAGAVSGSACDSFLESIEKWGTLDIPVLDRVKSTVESLELCIPKMEDHDMTFGDEVKEEMKRGRRFLDKLSEDNDLSWSKTSDNDQLVELDASLKSLVGKLRLQLATEVLVLGKQNATVVKVAKRKLDEVDETVKAGFLGSQTRLEVLLNKMEKLEWKFLGNLVDPLNEGAGLVDALGELHDVALELIARSGSDECYVVFCRKMTRRIELTFGLVEKKTAENKAMVYIPVGEVRDFRMSIKDGVNLLRNCPEVAVWTDELKLEYTNKFIALNKTLEALYNRLAGIRPLQWNCRKCDKSSGTTSTSIVDSAGFCH
ncbi:hypothetical protein ABKV19_008097 [Rosa sericea]